MSYQGAINMLQTQIIDAENQLVATNDDIKKNGKTNTIAGTKAFEQKRSYLLGLMAFWQVLVDASWVSTNQAATDLLNAP